MDGADAIQMVGLVAMEFDIRLDRSLTVPLYQQIAQALADDIRAGRLAAGEQLPTERRFAADLGVNRSTVVTAYDELDAHGLVRGYVGRGTIVERALGPAAAPAESMIWGQRAIGSEEAMSRAMREITHWLAGPDAIALNHASTAPELLPVDRIAAITCDVMEALGPDALDYSPTEGTDDLRDAIAGYMTGLGAPTEAPGILVTNGGQQAIDLVARSFVDRGDVVVVEAPTYPGAIAAFARRGARLVTVPMDDAGMRVDILERVLASGPVKLVFSVPNFSNPTGAVLTAERRRRLLQATRRLGVPVVADDVNGELGFEHRPAPLAATFADSRADSRGDSRGGGVAVNHAPPVLTDHVIHIGSLSKCIAGGGLRIGWIAAPPEVVALIARAKLVEDLGSPTVNQAVAAGILRQGLLDEYIGRIRPAIHERHDLLRAALVESAGEALEIGRPQGGLSLWCRLPGDLDARRLFDIALQRGVALVPGVNFCPGDGCRAYFRLCYGHAPVDALAPAGRKVGAGARELVAVWGSAIAGSRGPVV